jgi:translation initiation factor IF-1
LIFLDAEVTSVINRRAFRARLSNGHELVAYRGRGDAGADAIAPGAEVRVRLSPFDMSRGEIVPPAERGST